MAVVVSEKKSDFELGANSLPVSQMINQMFHL